MKWGPLMSKWMERTNPITFYFVRKESRTRKSASTPTRAAAPKIKEVIPNVVVKFLSGGEMCSQAVEFEKDDTGNITNFEEKIDTEIDGRLKTVPPVIEQWCDKKVEEGAIKECEKVKKGDILYRVKYQNDEGITKLIAPRDESYNTC